MTKFIKLMKTERKADFRISDMFKLDIFHEKCKRLIQKLGYYIDENREISLKYLNKLGIAYRNGARRTQEWYIISDMLLLIASEIMPNIMPDIIIGNKTKEELIQDIFNYN